MTVKTHAGDKSLPSERPTLLTGTHRYKCSGSVNIQDREMR